MGLDLTLCLHRYPSRWWLAYDRLGLHRDYNLFGQISSRGRGDGPIVCNPKPLPEGTEFCWYGDEGLENDVKTDQYDAPLTYVTAEELSRVKPPPEGSKWNVCVWEFISVLPPDTKILLWWH